MDQGSEPFGACIKNGATNGMRRIERMHGPRQTEYCEPQTAALGVRHDEPLAAHPHSLLLVHPLHSRHPLGPSVLDARRAAMDRAAVAVSVLSALSRLSPRPPRRSVAVEVRPDRVPTCYRPSGARASEGSSEARNASTP